MESKKNSAPPPGDEKMFGYEKPLPLSPEEQEKVGKPDGYVRFVNFENCVVFDAAISPKNLVKVIAEAMGQDEELAGAIQAAVAMYKVRKHPLGRILSAAMFSDDGPCGCPDCTEKREREANEEKPAEAEANAG